MPQRRRIIDAHHHLWDLEACHYPWLMERGVPRFFGNPEPIQRNYLAEELRKDTSDFVLAGSIHVQVGVAPGDEVRETVWLSEVAESGGIPSALVAFCDLAGDDAQDILDRHAGFPLVRGIRHIVGRSAEEDARTGSDTLLDYPNWVENLRSLRDRNLSFDLQLIPQQMERVVSVLEKIPGLRVALCHCGSPWDQSAAGLDHWRRGLAMLAALPDVFCKISGLSMFNHNWNTDDIRPIVEGCIELFGPDRCMFGSNFPVDKLHKSYTDIWRAYEEISRQFTSAEQARLFGGTAELFYRLD